MRHFFINTPISDVMIIDGADARHIALVLRMVIGDTLLIADRDG
ncbi:MAG: hypothetical protein K0R55_2220, partial [Sporomusa sp.]|nr:hypothetical protein [Sporomusa sp.]